MLYKGIPASSWGRRRAAEATLRPSCRTWCPPPPGWRPPSTGPRTIPHRGCRSWAVQWVGHPGQCCHRLFCQRLPGLSPCSWTEPSVETVQDFLYELGMKQNTQRYEIKLPPRAILGFKNPGDFFCWKLRQVGCYDVAKFRFLVNSIQLWINGQLSIDTKLNFATS